MPTTDLANAWFSKRGWKPFAFQRRVWAAVERGESGLLHASTGAGKTYAVWLAALRAFKAQAQGRQAAPMQKRVAPASWAALAARVTSSTLISFSALTPVSNSADCGQ